MFLLMIAMALVVGWLLGYKYHQVQTKDNVVEVTDTYIPAKKMSERSLNTQMAVKLANEIGASGCMRVTKEDEVYHMKLKMVK